MPNATIFKLVRGDKSGHLSKTIEADGEGGITKSGGGLLVSGKITTQSVTTLADLDALLLSLKSKQAVAWGVPVEERATRVASREAVEKVSEATGEITVSRTRDDFHWPEGVGVLMLDYDPEPGGEVLGMRRLVSRLRKAVPGLAHVKMLHRPSGSSLIYDSDGSELSGLSGQRLYMLVEDASDIPRAGEAIADRLWLAGEGRIEVSKAGSALKRTLVDTAVWQPERLDFAGGANLGEGLTQRREPGTILGDGDEVFDSLSAIPSLTEAERVQVEKLKARAQRRAQPALEKAFESWVSAQVSDGVPEWQAREAQSGAVLHGDFRIMVYVDGWQPEVVTVDQLLSEPERWHGVTCRDPLEPDYRGGAQVGKVFTDQDTPKLYSQAHGGVTYLLKAGEPRSREDDWAYLAEAMGIEMSDDGENPAMVYGGDVIPATTLAGTAEFYDEQSLLDWVFVSGEDKFYHFDTDVALSKSAFDLRMQRASMNSKGDEVKPSTQFPRDGGKIADMREYRPDIGDRYFRDEQAGLWILNTYRSFAVPEETDGDAWKVCEAHMRNILPDGWEEVLKWMASIVQNPGRRVLWSPVIIGEQGDGKTVLSLMMAAAMGDDNVGIVSPESLFSQFTGWAEGVCVNVLEEIRVTGNSRHSVMDKLKPFQTNRFVEVVKKGRDGRKVRNTVSYMALTNHEDALAIDYGDRRWGVFKTRFESREQVVEELTSEYWHALYDAIDNHGGDIRAWLMSIDLSEFSPVQGPVTTEAKKRMIELATGPEEAAVREAIELGGEGVASTAIATDCLNKLIAERIGGVRLNTSAMNRVLTSTMKWKKVEKTVWWNGKNRRLYVAPDFDLETAKEVLDATLEGIQGRDEEGAKAVLRAIDGGKKTPHK